MKLFSELPSNIDNSIVSIGVFDGVHLGHQSLFGKLRQAAFDQSKSSIIITFKNHPMSVLNQKFQPKFLMPLSERLKNLSSTKVDAVIPITFDNDLAKLSAKEFLSILKEKINLSQIVCGPDFALGRNREGTIEKLNILGSEIGFTVEIVPVFSLSEEEIPVRSSQARKELSIGNISSLNKVLGRKFKLSGTVHTGNQMGPELGFPTANISIDSNLAIPPDGIYATWVSINEISTKKIWMGATSIGNRPTFKEFNDLVIETYLLDFDEEIYNRKINIEFFQKIRDQKQFDSKNSLIKQMQIDIDTIRNILAV